MSVDKKHKRCKEAKTLLNDYIVKTFTESVEDFCEIEDFTKSYYIALHKIAFYLECKYDLNMRMIRDFFITNNATLNTVKKFIEDDISYDEVKEYFAQNFSQSVYEAFETVDGGDAVIVFDKGNEKFLSVTEENDLDFTDHNHATAWNFFMSKDVTKRVIWDYYINEFNPDLQDIYFENLEIIRVPEKDVKYYEKSSNRFLTS